MIIKPPHQRSVNVNFFRLVSVVCKIKKGVFLRVRIYSPWQLVGKICKLSSVRVHYISLDKTILGEVKLRCFKYESYAARLARHIHTILRVIRRQYPTRIIRPYTVLTQFRGEHKEINNPCVFVSDAPYGLVIFVGKRSFV